MTPRAVDLPRIALSASRSALGFRELGISGARTTTALLSLVDENLILRLKLAMADPATADLPGLDPAQFIHPIEGTAP